jgi:hypothetical protein
MENRKERVEKQLTTHNKTEERQNANKQMLDFDEVNFEQKREPYRETSNRGRGPGEVPDRWPKKSK